MFEIDRAVIEINGGCNYTCAMCPQTTPEGKTGARGKSWLKKMPLDLFEEAVKQCASAGGLNVVNLEGSGEATLRSTHGKRRRRRGARPAPRRGVQCHRQLHHHSRSPGS